MVKNKFIFITFVLLLSIFSVSAQSEKFTLVLSLNDVITNIPVQDILLQIIILNKVTNDKQTISTFLDESSFNLRLEKGNYDLTLLADDLNSDGKDYFAFFPAAIDGNKRGSIDLLPVGSVKGSVIDKNNNLVRDADWKVSCDRSYGELLPGKTDKFGSFSSLYLPVGDCQFTATFGSAIGTKSVFINQGESIDVSITLDKATVGDNTFTFSLILLFILVIILFLAGRFVLKKRFAVEKELKQQLTAVKKKKSGKSGKSEKKRSKRQEDLLNTLNEREKKIVEHLLTNKNKSTQAKIRYDVAIPKTSLVRIFSGLERKKIISVEKVGKLKKVKLTDWFLEKE